MVIRASKVLCNCRLRLEFSLFVALSFDMSHQAKSPFEQRPIN